MFGFVLIAITSACLALDNESYSIIAKKAEQSLLLDAMMVNNNIVVVGERGHILRSTDKGKSWQQMQVPTRQMLTATFFINEDLGWVVGHDGLILKTTDGGTTWEIQRDGLVYQAHINAEAVESNRENLAQLKLQKNSTSPAEKVSFDEAMEEAEMDLEDALLTFKEPVSASPLFDIWFRTALEGWAVGAYGLALHTLDGGIHWQTINDQLPNPDEMHLNAIVGTSDGSLWVVGESGFVLSSSDAGKNWQQQEFPYDGSLFGVVANSDASKVLAFGLRGNMLSTVDKGLSWQRVEVGTGLTMFGGVIKDESIVIVGNAGLLIEGNLTGDTFKATNRSNRLAMSAVVVLNKNDYIAVGDNGIHYIK